MLERDIEKYLYTRCERQGIYIDKFISSRNGVPDRLLIYNGRHVFIETKRPGGRARALQEEVHGLMRIHGAEVHVLDTRDKVDLFLEDLLSTPVPKKLKEYRKAEERRRKARADSKIKEDHYGHKDI